MSTVSTALGSEDSDAISALIRRERVVSNRTDPIAALVARESPTVRESYETAKPRQRGSPVVLPSKARRKSVEEFWYKGRKIEDIEEASELQKKIDEDDALLKRSRAAVDSDSHTASPPSPSLQIDASISVSQHTTSSNPHQQSTLATATERSQADWTQGDTLRSQKIKSQQQMLLDPIAHLVARHDERSPLKDGISYKPLSPRSARDEVSSKSKSLNDEKEYDASMDGINMGKAVTDRRRPSLPPPVTPTIPASQISATHSEGPGEAADSDQQRWVHSNTVMETSNTVSSITFVNTAQSIDAAVKKAHDEIFPPPLSPRSASRRMQVPRGMSVSENIKTVVEVDEHKESVDDTDEKIRQVPPFFPRSQTAFSLIHGF